MVLEPLHPLYSREKLSEWLQLGLILYSTSTMGFPWVLESVRWYEFMGREEGPSGSAPRRMDDGELGYGASKQ
ncbi:hypothetical protein HOLleu_27085 [Holothuria leucospilota]|uniref:Uncharacterized protein n=1 Tax=Holothuria leucospilota TaxID=206669 RepID=A0A9Q1BQ82_HOLLE|nr:hypothetical protein HOLleu_27085 [Holothuria leucospilota]